jgi:hypothetical protein
MIRNLKGSTPSAVVSPLSEAAKRRSNLLRRPSYAVVVLLYTLRLLYSMHNEAVEPVATEPKKDRSVKSIEGKSPPTPQSALSSDHDTPRMLRTSSARNPS